MSTKPFITVMNIYAKPFIMVKMNIHAKPFIPDYIFEEVCYDKNWVKHQYIV